MNTDQSLDPEPEGAVVPYRNSSMAVGQALGVDEILAQVRLIQEVMGKVMHEGEHYGKIPGCGDKKTLLQPGAQKLTMTFRLAPEYQIQESNLERGHKEYRVICTLKSIQSGSFVGQGVGSCSTMESKYRWRSAGRKCPKCGKETIIKGKAEYGGGWLCYGKKGGCGCKWADGAVEIESQSEAKVEHDNPADHFNTVLKMAKKRAFVDATITATAASDIFTQDINDDESDGQPDDDSQASHTTPAQNQSSAGKRDPAAEDAKNKLQLKWRKWLVDQLHKLDPPKSGEADGGWTWQYFLEKQWVGPEETLSDMLLTHLPLTLPKAQELLTEVQNWIATRKAENAPEPSAPSPATSTQPEPSAASKAKPEAKAPHPDDWREFKVPFGNDKGTALGDLDKKTLYGWWANFEVTTEYNGKPKKQETIEKDELFREMLDRAGEHYQFEEPS